MATAISSKREIVTMNISVEDDDARRENARVPSEISPCCRRRYLLACLLFSVLLNAGLGGSVVYLRLMATCFQQRTPLPPMICYSDPGFLASESQHSASPGKLKCQHSDPDLHRVVAKMLYQDMEEDYEPAGLEEASTVEDWKLIPTGGKYLTVSIRVLPSRDHGSGNILNSIYRNSNPSSPILCSKFTVQDSKENGRQGEGEITIVDADRSLSIVLGIVNLSEGESLKSTVSGKGCQGCRDQTQYFTVMKV